MDLQTSIPAGLLPQEGSCEPPSPREVNAAAPAGAPDGGEPPGEDCTIGELQAEIPENVPSPRNLQVYEEVVFRRRTQADVAREFGITPQRVGQIVRSVRLWKSSMPWQLPELTEQQQINLATHETRQWLETIRDLALEKLQETTSSVVREIPGQGDEPPATRSVTCRHLPKSGFLNIALTAVSRWGRLGGAGQQWESGCKGATSGHEDRETPQEGYFGNGDSSATGDEDVSHCSR